VTRAVPDARLTAASTSGPRLSMALVTVPTQDPQVMPDTPTVRLDRRRKSSPFSSAFGSVEGAFSEASSFATTAAFFFDLLFRKGETGMVGV
jgi:hypothetical protein